MQIHRTRPAPWRRQSRGFGTPFSMKLLSSRIKYHLLILLAFVCSELHVSFPQGKGTQHTGVTGTPAVPWPDKRAAAAFSSRGQAARALLSTVLEQGLGLLSPGTEAQMVCGTSQPLPCKSDPPQPISSAQLSPSPTAEHSGVLHSCTLLVVFFLPFTSHKAASSFPCYGSSHHPWFCLFAA